jgi:hypothetical protein
MHAVVVNVTISDFDQGRQMLETCAEDDSGMSIMVFESAEAAEGAADFIRSQPQTGAVTLESIEVREVVASA